MPRHLVLLLAILVLVVGGTSGRTRADDEAPTTLDRIHLDNGNIFEGHIVAENEENVILDLSSSTGGAGRLRFPRERIRRIERGVGGPPPRTEAGTVRDTWYLLRSGGAILGARHLLLRRVRVNEAACLLLEETIEHFARGAQVPAARHQRRERVDLAFRPLSLNYREIGEASPDPDGPRRYERIISGQVSSGIWDALVHEGGSSERRKVTLPDGGRARLGAREHLLRSREVGLQEVEFLDQGKLGRVTVRAGYTALGVVDVRGGSYDEFVWEEDGTRLVSRFRDSEVIEEAVARDVVAVPATVAQVEAARAEAVKTAEGDEPGLVRLADVGIAFHLPDHTWDLTRSEVSPLATGWRKVAEGASRIHMADLRVEWDPTGSVMAPGAEEAQARLIDRLRTVCPDLRVAEPRRALPISGPGQAAWRMVFLGTLKGELVRTVALVLDHGQGRALVLLACPEVSWSQASRSVQTFVDSIRRL